MPIDRKMLNLQKRANRPKNVKFKKNQFTKKCCSQKKRHLTKKKFDVSLKKFEQNGVESCLTPSIISHIGFLLW